jgi:non-canonical purine NTP pyrophosphatase (RdgB/HAM1 family)
MDRPTIIIASSNQNKATEFQQLLGALVDVLPAKQQLSVTEDGHSFAANAVKKAQSYALAFAPPFSLTSSPPLFLAEDSGIVVPSLGNGIPGLVSARFWQYQYDSASQVLTHNPKAIPPADGMNTENNRLLLELLKKSRGVERSAYFVSTLAITDSSGLVLDIFTGEAHGRISEVQHTDTGWGYDHVFIDSMGEHWGQLTTEKKNERSHRSRSCKQLRGWLSERYELPETTGNIDH